MGGAAPAWRFLSPPASPIQAILTSWSTRLAGKLLIIV